MSVSEEQVRQIIAQMAGQYQLAVAIACVAGLAAVGVVIAWWVYETFMTPLESKQIRKASRKKTPLCILGGDDGYGDIQHAAFTGPEGILQTSKKGVTREHYTGALPRPRRFDVSDITLSDPKNTNLDKAKTAAIANFVSSLANRRLILRGARIPVWFAYRGKAILTSLYGLAAIDIVEGMSKIKDFDSVFSAVDVVAIKALFSEQWNESQINANETDSERIGELKAKKFGGKDSLIMFFGIMICLVVVVIILVVASYYLSGGNSAPAAKAVLGLVR